MAKEAINVKYMRADNPRMNSKRVYIIDPDFDTLENNSTNLPMLVYQLLYITVKENEPFFLDMTFGLERWVVEYKTW